MEDGRLRSETYPDPLARVWSALTPPHAGDFIVSLEPGYEAVDWGGVTHAGGGSHGSLHAGDSLGPLLFVGCGPAAAPRSESSGRCVTWHRSCSSTSAYEMDGGARRRDPAASPRPQRRLRDRIGATEATQGHQPRPECGEGAPRARRTRRTAPAWSTATGRSPTSPTGKRWRWSSSTRARGEVRESWTGYQVAWKMARGYSGAFGHKLNAPYVFLPLCAIFLLGLVDWRRLRRVANLDLLVLLGFGVSHFFFNRAEIGVSVPLQYSGPALPPRPGASGSACAATGVRGLRPVWPAAWLLVAALFLMGFRVGLNIADSGADRRRLRRAWSAPTGSPTANRSTTTSPTTSPRATPTARSTTSPTSPSSGSGPGRAPGTTSPPPTAPRSSSTSPPSPS